jgi:hypothetical protein
MPEAWSVDYIKTNWCQIEEKSVSHSIFQSWAWVDCWLEIARKLVRPLIFKSNSDIVGICFIGFGVSRDLKFFRYQTIYPFLSGHPDIDIIASEYNSILCLPGYEEAVHLSLINFLRNDKRLSKYKRLCFQRISEEFLSFYKQASVEQKYLMDIYKTEKSACVHLDQLRKSDLDYDQYFSKSIKADIARSEKLYIEKYGSIKIEKPENVTQAQNWFQELGKLNKLRFQSKKEKSAWDYPELVRMHRAFLNRNFSKGNIEIIRLCAGDVVIGYLYNFIYQNVVYFYMGGFRYETDNKLKPGFLTHSYVIKEHYNNGKQIYDFMAGNQSYKYRMGVNGDNMFHFTMTKPGMKTAFVHMASKLYKMIKR